MLLNVIGTYVGSDYVPKGSLVIATPNELPTDLLKAIKGCGEAVKLVGPVSKFPSVPAILIKPPKIALFDNGALSEISLRDIVKGIVRLGKEPPIWLSTHLPGGKEFNKKLFRRYSSRIKLL